MMKQKFLELKVDTSGQKLVDISNKIENFVKDSKIINGIMNLSILHTSASLIIQENADPDVLTDLENFISKLVPEGAHYTHSTEGPDDMPAHIRSVLTHTSEQIPIIDGKLVLGTWQGIYVWEHRQRSHSRELVIYISGE